jgi:hypothetical protein
VYQICIAAFHTSLLLVVYIRRRLSQRGGPTSAIETLVIPTRIPNLSKLLSTETHLTKTPRHLYADGSRLQLRAASNNSNSTALNNLHIGSLIVNLLFLALHILFRSRSLFRWFLISIPSFVCQGFLEWSGRPSYDPQTHALRKSGEDLGAQGLTEYMFDVIWVTWGVTVLAALFGNWAWYLWANVPAFGIYKVFGMASAAKKMASGMSGTVMDGAGAGAPAGNRKQRRAAA